LKLLILPIPLQVKKLGKKADMLELRSQLGSIGLKIVEVTADGNCFFRFWIIFLSWYFVHLNKRGGGGFSTTAAVGCGYGISRF
jgi:hypothetical protein